MIALYPVLPFGTIAAQTTRLLGRVSAIGSALVVRGIDLYTSTAIGPSNADYWSVQVGIMVGGDDFVARGSWSKPFVGIAQGINAVEFPQVARFAVGEPVAVRLTPTGVPSSLTECDVVVRLEEA